MKVAVRIVGEGRLGDPSRPEHVLHGQMHYDPPHNRVVYTDETFTEEELALPGVVLLEAQGAVETAPTEPVKQKGGSRPRKNSSGKRSTKR